MMLEKRIIEAEGNVRSYLAEGMLKKTNDVDKNILAVFRKNSEESLLVAGHIFKNNLSSLWVVVCSYYSLTLRKTSNSMNTFKLLQFFKSCFCSFQIYLRLQSKMIQICFHS